MRRQYERIRMTPRRYGVALTKVYTFGPTFRGENSNTTSTSPSSG
jgi:hypothetical protein